MIDGLPWVHRGWGHFQIKFKKKRRAEHNVNELKLVMTELIKSSTTYCMFDALETEKITSSRSMVSNIGIALTQACNTSWLPKTIAQGRTKPDSYRCKWRHASPSSPLLLALWIICICHSATRSHIGSPEYWINGSTILVSIAFVPVFCHFGCVTVQM